MSAKYCSAQQYDTVKVADMQVQMDTFIVKSGFDIDAFIRRVKADTTFYKAFRTMRLVPYTAINDIVVLNKNGTIEASLHSSTKQNITDHCRATTVLEENTTGDFYDRKGQYNYYTAELFASLFFSKKPVCNESDIVATGFGDEGKGIEKRKYELKQLIFNPGAKISGIPFTGDRASIFDPGEVDKYDFKVVREMYDGQQCYVFRITPKKGYEHKVIYNELTTWFRKDDYSIVARDYSLSYSTMVYDFDVHMKVRTSQINGKLLPTYIDYDGNWHVFTKNRERAKFSVVVKY